MLIHPDTLSNATTITLPVSITPFKRPRLQEKPEAMLEEVRSFLVYINAPAYTARRISEINLRSSLS